LVLVAKGKLRIYLGAAPGVGKTYAMLNEGARTAARGRDVLIGLVETHDRAHTADQQQGLEILPRKEIAYRAQTFEEMDVDAILARRPSLVLIDELAHTNVSGSRHAKRWQDVEEILGAGISVLSTVNIQHLESLNDVVRQITGVAQRETVPDKVVRDADQIELVDMSPESLRRRMAHGNIYKPERVDTALANYFRIGNLSALRELALLWVADRVDEGLQAYRERHGIGEPWETKERVVVALTGNAQGERLIRRGARMAARGRADLVGVHVRPTDGLASRSNNLEQNRAILAEMGGRYAEVSGNDVATALVGFARAENATQLLLGATTRARFHEAFQGSVINQVIRAADGIDVHVLSTRGTDGTAPTRRLPRVPGRRQLARLSRQRRTAGWTLAAGVMPLLLLLLTSIRGNLGTTGGLPELLFLVVVVAVVGGLLPAVVSAVAGFILADWFLIPPLHSLTIDRAGDAGALVSFVIVALLVSGVIDLLTRRGAEMARAHAESEAFARLAGGAVLAPQEALPALVDQLRATFGADGVAVLAPGQDNTGWTVQAAAGGPIPAQPEDASFSAELAQGSVLVIVGGSLTADDRRLLAAFVTQLRVVQEQQQLQATAAVVTSLEEANELRTALLSAVSHDLRTPLASIKACATSLLCSEIDWDAEARRAFCETIDVEADRLNHLVGNLLDMSRLQTGVLQRRVREVGLEEVVYGALASLSGDTRAIHVDVPETLPPVLADPDLLERSVANLVANALAYTPAGHVVAIRGHEVRPDQTARHGPVAPVLSPDRQHLARNPETYGVQLHIVDNGPGIAARDRESVFQPFQRLGDQAGDTADGVGLGLAVARGFVHLMGGQLVLDDTPGGGLTAIIALPTAGTAVPPLPPPPGPGRPAPVPTAPVPTAAPVPTPPGPTAAPVPPPPGPTAAPGSSGPVSTASGAG
jgi:two-component system sensor histidine kinase KdpD